MCGIIGYVGAREAKHLLISGLNSMEYRGYDSSGMSVLGNNSLSVLKMGGPVINLSDNAKFLGRDTDKFGEWNMDEGFGSTSADTSGNQNMANLLAGAFWFSSKNNLVSKQVFAMNTSTSIVTPLSLINKQKEKGKKMDGLDNVIDSDHGKAPMKINKEKKKYPINMNIEGEYYSTHDPLKLEDGNNKN